MENGRRTIKTDIAGQLSVIVPGFKFDEPLKDHTTYRVGGPAKYFVDVRDAREVHDVRELALRAKLPFLVLGGGSNVLIGDHGFPGIVIRLAGTLAECSFSGEVLSAGAGARLSALVHAATEQELTGLECLSGVPGTAGGALVGNAGTSDEWIGGVVREVTVLSEGGEPLVLKKGEGAVFAYRGSNLEGRIVLGAVFDLKKSAKNDILNKIKHLMRRRTERQPLNALSAGSVFKNPPGDSAGRLIEAAGLKGLRFGGAQVSEKHANFLINSGEASAADIRTLISIVRQKVKERFGIDLDLEIKVIGE